MKNKSPKVTTLMLAIGREVWRRYEESSDNKFETKGKIYAKFDEDLFYQIKEAVGKIYYPKLKYSVDQAAKAHEAATQYKALEHAFWREFDQRVRNDEERFAIYVPSNSEIYDRIQMWRKFNEIYYAYFFLNMTEVEYTNYLYLKFKKYRPGETSANLKSDMDDIDKLLLLTKRVPPIVKDKAEEERRKALVGYLNNDDEFLKFMRRYLNKSNEGKQLDLALEF